jgi:hypothetical protein
MRLAYNWSKCRRLLESTGMTHGTLLYYNRSYSRASERYQESKQHLVEQGEYITAQSQMKAYQKVSVG